MKSILTTLILATAALAQTTPANDALDSLRTIQSATEIGINLRDYSTRVLDAKLKVDKYLADAPKDDAARPAIETAMRAYILAVKIWMTPSKYGPPVEVAEEVMASPQLSACGIMPRLIAQATADSENWKPEPLFPQMTRPTPAGKLRFQMTKSALWQCAAAKLEGLKK